MTGNVLLTTMLDRSPKWARSLVLAGYRGSHAHGTYIPPEDPNGTDDIDVFGVTIHPLKYYLGVDGYLNRHDTFNTNLETLDIETHEIRKFMHLLYKGNPNVHSYLWMEPEDYFLIDRAGRLLIDHREQLLSRRMLQSFGGYAYAQLSRMQKFEKQGYMGAKREQIVREHGYDIKNAADCLRLLLGACALAEHKRVMVRLRGEDLALVLGVKRGEHSFEWVQRKAVELFGRFDAVKGSCDLPDDVDPELLNHLTNRIISLYWEER